MKARPKRKPAFQSATLLAGALLLLIVFVSAGFIVTTHPGDDTTVEPGVAALAEAKRLWRYRQPDTYSYLVDRDCSCEPRLRASYRVLVGSDTVTFSAQEGDQTTPEKPRSIAQIFELLDNALLQADAVSVTYDPDFGYPDNVRIDWNSDRSDDEESLYIRDFREIP